MYFQPYVLIFTFIVTTFAHGNSNQNNPVNGSQCFVNFDSNQPALDPSLKWLFNTSNSRKRQILDSLIHRHNISWEGEDLEEIDADDISVVVHKASRFHEDGKRVIVEDSALYVDGVDIGTNIRWMASELSKYIGRKAVWVSLLAYRDGDVVKVFRGETAGMIVEKSANIGGIEDHFKPDSSSSNGVSPSLQSMRELLLGHVHVTRKPITDWSGKWQKSL